MKKTNEMPRFPYAQIILLPLLLLVATATASAQQARPPLQSAAEQAVRQAGGDWSVFAWSIDRKAPLFAVNATDVLIPASNNKVFTAIWALDLLGPDYRFPTDLLVVGPVENGVLRGHVILRGSGDPAFGYPEFERDPKRPLRVMAERLREMGIRTVAGSVIGDGSAFDPEGVGPAWPRDTGNGAAYYAPRVSGLAYQRNVVWVQAVPGPGGVEARLDPDVDAIPLVSTLRPGGGRAYAVRKPDEDTIRVRGSVAGRGPHRYPVGVSDPAVLAAGALRQALLEAGIAVQGPSRSGSTPRGARLLHRHYSMPLGLMIPKLNQDSDNFFAEHLWQAAAREAVGAGSFQTGGPASALHFIRRARVPVGELFQYDGSGLSSHNRASARALVQALVYAHDRPYSDLFHRSMAVAGDRQGTMRRLFVGTAAQNNLHAKTGYIVGVRALAGYVRAANGEMIAFAFLYNGRGTSAARGVQTELGTLLANYGAAAPVPSAD